MDRETADGEIRERLAADDASALGMIWDLYSSDLLGYLVSILCSRHDAEDVLQELFGTIARKRAAVARVRLLKPYLFRSARNAALNYIKRSKRMRERTREISEWLVLDGKAEARDEQTGQVEAALASLPEKQRSVIVLKFYRNKTFREIGEMLIISENTAGSRYRYGMNKLRGLLEETSS